MSYRTARVADIDIHYELADYTPEQCAHEIRTFIEAHRRKTA